MASPPASSQPSSQPSHQSSRLLSDAPPAISTRDVLAAAAGLSGAVGMVLSATVINVGVPSIMGAFGIGQYIAQWASTAFLATMVTAQLLNALIVRKLGERATFLLMLVMFTGATTVSALAPSIEILVISRIFQGFAAGVVLPMVLALLVGVFPLERRAMAIGIYGVAVTMAPSFGPIIGGIVLDALTWRHIFFVPMPLIFLAFVLGGIYIPGKPAHDDRPAPEMDWLGLVLITTTMVCLMTGLANGQRWGWETSDIMMLLSGGVAAGIGFIWWQLHAPHPILDLGLFKDPAFASAMFIAFLVGAGNFASQYAIPVFVQTVQNYSAMDSGLVLVPGGVLLLLVAPVIGRLSDAMPPHIPIIIGVFMFSAAAYLFADTDVNSAYWTLALIALLSRAGIGFVIPNMGAAAMRPVPREKLNSGAGTYNFCRQIGGAFGVLLYVVMVEQRTAFHADTLIATQTSANPATQETLSKVGALVAENGLNEAMQESLSLEFLSRVVHAQATTFGFQDGFLAIAAVFLLAVIPAWVLRGTAPKPLQKRMFKSA